MLSSSRSRLQTCSLQSGRVRRRRCRKAPRLSAGLSPRLSAGLSPRLTAGLSLRLSAGLSPQGSPLRNTRTVLSTLPGWRCSGLVPDRRLQANAGSSPAKAPPRGVALTLWVTFITRRTGVLHGGNTVTGQRGECHQACASGLTGRRVALACVSALRARARGAPGPRKG